MEKSSTENGTADPVQRLNDFSDWLSPMLVKELRQGFRAKAFAVGFVVLQAILALNLFVTIPTASALGGVTRPHFLFFMISAALLAFQPIRGISALSSEVKNDTLETILLTRLSSWRITMGKWASLVSQSLLIVISVIPYLFMRYMLGGADLFMELLMVFYMLIFSAFLCAVGVALSVIPNFIIRAAATFFAGWGIIGGFVEGFWSPFFRDRIIWDGIDPWLFHLLLFFGMAYLTYTCLQLGAASIAARAENHASRLRIVSFVVIAIALILGTFAGFPAASLALSLGVLAVVAFLGFLEEPNDVPSVYAAFKRRGALGRITAPFLMPGWHSMVLYSFLMISFITGFTYCANFVGLYGEARVTPRGFPYMRYSEVLYAIAFPGTAYTLVALASLFRRRSQTFRFSLFLMVAICGILTLILMFLIDELHFPPHLIFALFFLPSSYLIYEENYRSWQANIGGSSYLDQQDYLGLVLIVSGITTLVLAFLCIRAVLIHRRIARNAAGFERQSAESQNRPPGPAEARGDEGAVSISPS